MEAPCKDCKKRIVGCHANCEEYKKFDNFCVIERHKRLLKWHATYAGISVKTERIKGR